MKTNKRQKSIQLPPVEQHVAQLVKNQFHTTQTPVVIAVGGPGGTGKSTFSKRLAHELNQTAILRLDDYKTYQAFRSFVDFSIFIDADWTGKPNSTLASHAISTSVDTHGKKPPKHFSKATCKNL